MRLLTRLTPILLGLALVGSGGACAERPGPKKESAKKKAEVKKAREKREKDKKKKGKAKTDKVEKKDAPSPAPKTGDAAKSADKPAG
jgi:hypothetical protein